MLGNEEEVKKVLSKGNLVNINIEDTAKMSYYEQLKVIQLSMCCLLMLILIWFV